jgi:uncharacterized protein with HEPN domain
MRRELSSKSRQVLSDIHDAMRRLREYTEGVPQEQFLTDSMRKDAVVRVLEIVSEASRGVDQGVKDRYPKIDWQALADAGNIYRHRYGAVDYVLVWSDIHSPEFHGLMEMVLAELPFLGE